MSQIEKTPASLEWLFSSTVKENPCDACELSLKWVTLYNRKPHSRHKQPPFESRLIPFVASLCLFFIRRHLLLLPLNVSLHIGHEYDVIEFECVLVLDCFFNAVVSVVIFTFSKLLYESC